jgi:AcrR family transcriptional regulator
MSATSIERADTNRNGDLAVVRARDQIADIQRGRIVEATASTVAEVGARNVTVAHIVARAGVSRRTFYEAFDSCEDCVLAAFDDAVAQAAARVASESTECADARWPQRVRVGLAALLRYMDEQPAIARLLVVESLGAGPRTLARRQAVYARLVAAIDEARADSRSARDASPLAAEGAVGAVIAVLHNQLIERPGDRLLDLLNPLTSMIVLPFLGSGAARRELDRPAPPGSSAHFKPSSAALGKLDMRLTYRTVRVLAAVAASPGSSNRAIGASAGISDQGQASKLLRRLQGLGLVENVPKEPLRGEPNAWTLTDKGWQVHAAVRAEEGVA